VKSARCGSIAALLLTLAVTSAGASDLRPFKAIYDVSYGGRAAGTSELHLQQLPDGSWSYDSRITVRTLVRLLVPNSKIPPDEHSRFRIQDGRIVPDSFSAAAGSRNDSRAQHLQFDWLRGRLTGTAERKRVDMPLQPGMLDTMSVQVALMLDLASGREPSRVAVFDTDRIKEYAYAAEGTATISTDVGDYQTVIYRSSRTGSDKTTVFWCAPELGYLPLRVERHDGKDVQWSLAVKSLERSPPR
jgi:hypothetical protein